MVARFFAYITLGLYLVVGTVAVRFYMPKSLQISFSNSYLQMFPDASLKATKTQLIEVPVIAFKEIKIPVEKKIITRVKANKLSLPEVKIIHKLELPFYEPIILSQVVFENVLDENLMAFHKDFSFQENLVAELKQDEISTEQSSVEVEPEFFEYEKKDEVAQAPVEKAILKEAHEKEVVSAADEDLVAFDYGFAESQEKVSAPASAPVTTQTQVSNVGFDYSQAQLQGPKIASSPVPSRSSAPIGPGPVTGPDPKGNPVPNQESESNAFLAATYPSQLTIQATGIDLKSQQSLNGFEMRLQDDLSDAREDYGTGAIQLKEELSNPKMTRSVTLLKRGYIPTNTELILEEGEGKVSIPLVEEETYNKLSENFEAIGPIGAVLVELDDETDLAQLDVPFGKVITLNGDLRKTKSRDFRYQLLVGVKAGNALLSYKDTSGNILTKIIHVHEDEVVFDANYVEDVVNEKIQLFEEDLLAKVSSPLIISGEQVKIFATEKSAKKINNHTYKLNFESSHLGGRRYVELNHQDEPIFLGLRDNQKADIPSENFMRYILSRFEGSKLGERCLVQINLNKKAESFEVASESEGASLMLYPQVLDNDGKFYDSLSENTKKIIIVGENHGSGDISKDGKINVKIKYMDGTVLFLGSYCSPNTYLVEQL